jgi:hypothetical protein
MPSRGEIDRVRNGEVIAIRGRRLCARDRYRFVEEINAIRHESAFTCGDQRAQQCSISASEIEDCAAKVAG